MSAVVVAGTDTGIGKTLLSAGLTMALAAHYWKPVQAGLADETDSQAVARLSGRPVLPEAYRLALPASPHLAAAREGVAIDPGRLALPALAPLVVEGAGGLMVPLTPGLLYLQIIAGWGAPVVLCARTALGTINHTLLSLAALRAAGCRLAGVVFIGDEAADSRAAIAGIGGVRDLGRLPWLAEVTPQALRAGFSGVDVGEIRRAMA